MPAYRSGKQAWKQGKPFQGNEVAVWLTIEKRDVDGGAFQSHFSGGLNSCKDPWTAREFGFAALRLRSG